MNLRGKERKFLEREFFKIKWEIFKVEEKLSNKMREIKFFKREFIFKLRYKAYYVFSNRIFTIQKKNKVINQSNHKTLKPSKKIWKKILYLKFAITVGLEKFNLYSFVHFLINASTLTLNFSLLLLFLF